MHEIKTWLNQDGSYQEGVAIFTKYSTNRQLVELFTAEMVTEYKRNRLKQAMKDLFKQLPQVVTPLPASHPDPVMPAPVVQLPAKLEKEPAPKTPGRWSDPGFQDQVEMALFVKWQPLFLERANLQARIYDLAQLGAKDPGKKDQAGQMAHRILDLGQTIRMIYQQRDEYFATGSLPAPDQPAQYAVDPVTAAREFENAKRYVRTMKRKLQRNPGDQAALDLLAKHQAAVAHYTEFFKISK